MFVKLYLKGIPNRKVEARNRYQLANEQEQFVVDKLRIIYPHVEWYTTTEYMGAMNPEHNRILGDLIGIKKNKGNMKPDIFIDLKVCEYGVDLLFVGSITIDSISGFAYKQKGHYYICSNADGSDFIVVDCKDIYNLLYNKTTKCLRESYWHKYPKPEYNKFIDRFIHQKKFEGVSGKDYIPGHILRKYDKRKGEV